MEDYNTEPTSNTDKPYKVNTSCIGALGTGLSTAGCIITNIQYTSSKSRWELRLTGPILLASGLVFVFYASIYALHIDWQNKTPRESSWKKRIRKDFIKLSWGVILSGLPMAITGLYRDYSRLGIYGGCSAGMVILGELLLMCSLMYVRYMTLDEEQSTVTGQNGDTNVESDTSTKDSVISPYWESLQSDFSVMGLALYVPGLGISCIAWWEGLTSAVIGGTLLSVGMFLLITAALIPLCVSSNMSKMSEGGKAMGKITLMCSFCGVIMTPVGFTGGPRGPILGFVGVAFLGAAVLSCLCGCCCMCVNNNEETNPLTVTNAVHAENGQSGSTNISNNLAPALNTVPGGNAGHAQSTPQTVTNKSTPQLQSISSVSGAVPQQNYPYNTYYSPSASQQLASAMTSYASPNNIL